MVKRVLIIGGYGNFGSYIARSLADDDTIQLLIGGRSEAKGGTFIAGLNTAHPAESHAIDISGDVHAALYQLSEAAFRDITQGNNGTYQAGPGWDACTGLGSPNGQALLSALSAQQAH